jgi:hypothetical protein
LEFAWLLLKTDLSVVIKSIGLTSSLLDVKAMCQKLQFVQSTSIMICAFAWSVSNFAQCYQFNSPSIWLSYRICFSFKNEETIKCHLNFPFILVAFAMDTQLIIPQRKLNWNNCLCNFPKFSS